MKTEKGTLQKEQIKYRDLLQKVGYNWELCRSLKQFQHAIKNYLN